MKKLARTSSDPVILIIKITQKMMEAGAKILCGCTPQQSVEWAKTKGFEKQMLVAAQIWEAMEKAREAKKCDWPECTEDAICVTEIAGGALVCGVHFLITNGRTEHTTRELNAMRKMAALRRST